jgi:signal transduction histidine kinase
MSSQPPSTSPPRPRRRWVNWALILLAWSVPAVIFAVLSHARMVALNQESSLWIWLADHLASWYTWAAFSPLIIWLGRKYRVDRSPRLQAIGVHLIAGIIVAFAHSAIATFASVALHGEPLTMEHYSDVYIRWLAWNSPWSLVIYWIVLGSTYAVDYYARARREELRSARLESEVAKAQLDALQRQLQPHFLFNTLNSIAVLTQKGDSAAANVVVGQLSELLRYALRTDGAAEVSLADELDFVRRYLEIERVRFGERLTVTYDVPAAALTARIPPFVLQLLVENAIRHGVAKRASPGHVGIMAERTDGILRVQVDDDGVGLSEETGAGPGLGIRNARERLAHLYGDRFRLELTNRPEGGVRASLDIPVLP